MFVAGVVEVVWWWFSGAGDPDAVSCGGGSWMCFEGFGGAGGVAVVFPGTVRMGFVGCGAVVECALFLLIDAGFALDEFHP